MSLIPKSLLDEFTKAVSQQKQKVSPDLYGTYREIGGESYVLIDGATLVTPVTNVVEASDGDRVMVRINDHKAIVTGNFSDKATTSGAVDAKVEPLEEGIATVDGRVDTLDESKMSIDDFCLTQSGVVVIDGGKIYADAVLASRIMANDIYAVGNITFDNDYFQIYGSLGSQTEDGELTIATTIGDLKIHSGGGNVKLDGASVRLLGDSVHVETPMGTPYENVLRYREPDETSYPYMHSKWFEQGSKTINFYKNTGSSATVNFTRGFPGVPFVFANQVFDTANVHISDVTATSFKITIPAVGSTGTRDIPWFACYIPNAIPHDGD